MKPNFQLNIILINKIKNNQLKKNNKLIRLTRSLGHETGTTNKKC
jgi:hypothetical protein